MTTVATDIRPYAEFYRSMGWQPLPSDPSKKKPLVKFAEYWEQEAPLSIWSRFSDCNIQVMCGRYWGLCVIDLDGREAVDYFESSWERHLPRTWVSYHSNGGRDSRHYWFRTPASAESGPPVRKKVLWQGEGPHSAIELLCDRCLVMAPPSIHPRTGNRYRWVRGLGPQWILQPAILPKWHFELPDVKPVKQASPVPDRPVIDRPRRRSSPGRLRLDAIPDKAAIARWWGLRFAANAGESDGWVSVHDFNRPDVHPSARFNLVSGAFWRPGEPIIRFCDLGVALGVFRDWRECRDWLAERYI